MKLFLLDKVFFKSLCPCLRAAVQTGVWGWMLWAVLRQRGLQSSCREERGHLMVFWEVVMTICSIFHSATVQLLNHTPFQYVNMLSMVKGHKQFLDVLVLPGSEASAVPAFCLCSRSGPLWCAHRRSRSLTPFPHIPHWWKWTEFQFPSSC